MRKKTLIYLLAFILIVCFTIVYQKEYRYNLYIMDTEKNTVSQIGDKKYNINQVEWANDNKKFIFNNEKSNSIVPPYFDNLVLYSLLDNKITILPYNFAMKFKYRDIIADFINDEEILINRYNAKDQNIYEIFNIKSEVRSEIAYKDIDKYRNSDYDKAKKEWDMYELPEPVAAKVREAAGSEYFEAVINYNRDTVVYRTENHEVYSLDLNSGYIKFLFKGFYLTWSPSGTKITFLTHKSKSLDKLGDYDGGFSEDLITYVYDFNTGKSTKVADFGTWVFFSNDDRYIVFYENGYIGWRGPM